MIRKVTISARLAILITMMGILVIFTILSFYIGLKKIKTYYSEQFKTELLDTQKDKIKIGTHTIALTISNLIDGIDDETLKIKAIRNTIDAIRYEKDNSGYYFVYEGTVNIAHPNHQYHNQDLANLKDINNNYFIKEAYKNSINGGGFNNLVFKKPGKGDQPKIVYAEAIPNTNYWIATGVYLDNIEEAQQKISNKVNSITTSLIIKILIAIFIMLFLIALPLSIAIRRSIIKPIERAIKTTIEIANGNLNVELRDNFTDEIGKLHSAIRVMIEKLKSVLENVKLSSTIVFDNSSELNKTVEQMAIGANRQAATTEEISSSMSQIQENVKESSKNAILTNKISDIAANSTQESSVIILQVVKVINDINNKIGIVEEIARQTNLLAINAAIEAARAGQHGKGFAAVANEVKKLAEKSQEASKRINLLSTESSEIAENANNTLIALTPEIQKVSKLVNEISHSSSEQSDNINEITISIQDLDNVIQQNATSSEQLAAASDQLSKQAKSLQELINYFSFE